MAGPGTRARSVVPMRGLVVIMTFVAAAAGFVLACDGASACVGARPLAMGGAFIAVADDASAVYWNPAGVAGFGRRELGLTVTLNNRDTFNYDEFLAYAGPGPIPESGVGLGLVSEHVGSLEESEAYRGSTWLVCSAACLVSRDLALGANLRYEAHARRLPGRDLVAGSRWGLDLALLYRPGPELSLGLLLQDSGFSPIRWGDGQEDAVPVNIRPGIAFRPDPATILAVDLYDLGALVSGSAGEEGGGFAVRAGVERRVTKTLTARLGYYGISPWAGAITWGAGWQRDAWQVDYVYLGAGTVPGHPGLGGTHQIGVTLKF
ncbi:MAG: hypothetical protein ACM3X3_08650 [Betaproteobacteria bacterium]